MGLKEKTITSVKWNIVATISCTLIQILRLSILTYLLDKSDFGIIAIALMVISFTDIFSELGITVALLHKQGISDKQYSSVYWLNIVMSILLTLIVCAIAPLVAKFYNTPILTSVVSLLSLQILFNGFGKMFQTIKTKNLEFDFISKVRIGVSLIGLIVTVVLAYIGCGVYSLVFGQLIQILVNQLVYVFKGVSTQKILFYFSFHDIKDIMKIGSWQLGSQVLDFFSAKLDVFLVARFFSMEDLGVYNIAKELITRPYSIVNGISANVFSAAFTKIQSNMGAIRANYLKLITVIALICSPIYVGTFVFADLIVAILYAPEFSEVAIFLRILALVGISSAITSQGGVLQISTGRTDIGFRWTVIRVILSTLILLLTCVYSIYVVAYGQLFLAIMSLIIYYYIVINPLLKQITLFDYCRYFGNIFMYSCILGVPFIFAQEFLNINLFGQFILGLIYLFGYILIIRFRYQEMFRELIGIFAKNLIK